MTDNLLVIHKIPSFNNPFVTVDIAKPNKLNAVGVSIRWVLLDIFLKPIDCYSKGTTTHQRLLFLVPFYPTYKKL